MLSRVPKQQPPPGFVSKIPGHWRAVEVPAPAVVAAMAARVAVARSATRCLLFNTMAVLVMAAARRAATVGVEEARRKVENLRVEVNFFHAQLGQAPQGNFPWEPPAVPAPAPHACPPRAYCCSCSRRVQYAMSVVQYYGGVVPGGVPGISGGGGGGGDGSGG
ncbi:hypothetical protein FIE12Z_4860 [Fusarium flagelliforme]|uniref:Uncharacterized protein n=1 Tax=Fusarium flagelliforme TaxID=2675880 RepID=A0A395MSI0_9HYPO|nr:hypothetical protein FIE12Z_4860 [Fusarium flagelliforme]